MTASEFAFLALGLLLGAACGAALVEVLRSRPPSRREIRVTVAPNSIPRRATTLAEAETADRGPARGGPADRREMDRDMPPDDDLDSTLQASAVDPVAPVMATFASGAGSAVATGPGRTPVPSGASSEGPAGPFRLTTAAGLAAGGMAVAASRAPVGITISREPDPMVAALRATAAATAAAAIHRTGRRGAGAGASAGVAVAAASGGDDEPADAAATAAEPGAGVAAAGVAPDDGSGVAAPDDACADLRRVADERCAVATRAREGAAAAQETLRARQRAYDDLLSSAEAAAATADPRSVRAAKEAAQLAFRDARATGRTRDDVETAARDWLTEINRINIVTRDAAATAEKHQRAAADIARDLERLSVEADAARISAESADEACVAAREAVATCQEAAVIAATGATPTLEPAAGDDAAEIEPDEDRAAAMGSRAGEDAAIIRMLRGDREVMTRVVATLAGDDEAERRRWQGMLGGLLEALIARSIEAAAFDFPLENSFWSPFTRSQARDVAGALASLGYRHDGFGGWADDRVPSQRDLSLAVGYAGLDPMRIRRWPSEAEMPDLLRDVTVAADEYVWEAAGGLTLGELVSLLGRRADGLAELWNEWGNVRPLLLSAG